MRVWLGAVAAAAAMVVGAAGSAQAATEMRCSHQLPPAHHIAKVIDRWAAEVETLSKGEIDVQVFGASSLVGAKENIPSVAKGNIECAFSINPQWGKTLPLMNVTLRPFSITDLDTLAKWPDSKAAAYLDEKLLGKGVRNVVWLFTTRMSTFTSKGRELIKPDDFKGVKIRGLGPTADAGLVAMGAAPVSMSGGEVYQALATGVIDAGMTDVSAAWSRKYYEVQDHFNVLPLFSVYFHGYLNPAWYDKLSDAQKAAITTAGKKAAAWAVEETEKEAADAPDNLKGKGVSVHMATEAEMKVLKAAMLPAFDAAFAKEAGADGAELLKLVDQIGK